MTTEVCSSCFQACSINTESGDFDAHGPAGTIRGNMGDLGSSDCCGDPVEEIDSDLHAYWLELVKLAADADIEWVVSDYPADHFQSFEDGVTAREFINSKLPS